MASEQASSANGEMHSQKLPPFALVECTASRKASSEAPPRTAEVGGWVGWLTCAWAVAVLGFSGHAGLRGCVMTKRPVTTTDVLDGHVSLDLECLDRIYLNGYVPNLQVGGQVVQFLAAQGFPIPSPAVVNRIGERFRDGVRRFAAVNQIPVVKFRKGDRKIAVMQPYLRAQAATGR